MPEHIASSFADYTQATRLLRLRTPLGADKLLAECVRGEEAIGSGYTFTITALSLDAGISLRALLGQPALLELLTVASGEPRPFHGYLTSVELNGANGGMARYTLGLQPWTAFLSRTRDSRVFRDMTVFDILDTVFRTWQGRGKLVPAWRFDIADRSIYPVRSLTTQYQESDLAFAERLMSEEGLFHFFDHEGAPGSPDLGTHTMVIADHNGAFKPNVQPSVRFTRPGAMMKEDSMDRWRQELRMVANAVELSSWDYRTRSSRPVSSSGAQAADADLVSRDAPGQYAYPSRSHGQCVADRQMQALEARQEVFIGAGTVRTLAPGTTFALAGHAVHDMEDSDDKRSFVVTRVVHLMNNNLSAELKANVAERVGESALALMNAAEQAGSLHAIGNGKGERPLYRNRIDAIRVAVPYRTSLTGSDGRLLHPRPTSRGQQTAIVVGPPGAVIHTDRDQMSHSRLNHPYPDGHVGAPGDDTAGTWVRVATPLAPIAGTNWGSVAVPRVGQEVLVDFLEGNIDRPVIVGAVYNGRGANDAQHNKVSHGAGVATGNAPAWFPGEAGAHAHPAVLSGIKSQAMRESQSGAGAYSQLVFDDSPGQARVALQRHASAHKGTDELNLGHLRHQVDNKRLAPIGFGAELKTEHNLALRGGDGLLVSADARNNGGGNQLDSHEPLVQLEQSLALQAALARTAQKHSAEPGRDAAGQGPDPTKLPAIDALERSINALKSTASAGRQADAASLERVTAYSEPLLQLSSPAGIVATSPANAVFVAGDVSNINAGQDINLVAEGANFHATKAGITLFTYGKASSKGKPNQETGIRLHAASGKVSSQSQSGETRITADKIITVASVTKHVKVESKRHVLLTAQGACLKLEGGNITVQAPGKVEFKATMKELAGPADGSVAVTKLSKAKDIYNEAFVIVNEETKEPMAHVRYRLESSCGVRIEGFTDALGRTQRVFTSKSETLTLHLPKED